MSAGSRPYVSESRFCSFDFDVAHCDSRRNQQNPPKKGKMEKKVRDSIPSGRRSW